MKRIFTSVLMLIILSSFVSSVSDMVDALKAGNASQISKYFDNTVDLTLQDKTGSYSKSQAELVLKDFFVSNGVIDFGVIHTGDNSGSQYLIGSLKTKKGTFRTTIYMKQKADKQVLQELRFEK